MLYLEFARDLDTAHFAQGIGTLGDETQTHVVLGFAPMLYGGGAVGSKVAIAPEDVERSVGLMFFHPESIDVVIHNLTLAKEELMAKLNAPRGGESKT